MTSRARHVVALHSGSAAETRTFAAYRGRLAGQTTIGAAWRDTEVGAAAAALHHHGVLAPPTGAEVLLAAPDVAAVVYLDRTSTAGTMLVSTIDPLAHFGHTGAPNAAGFLDALLLWVTTALPRRRDGS
jgi:hypothetical protein